VTVLGTPPRDDAAFWRAVALVADQRAWYPGLTLREHLELVRLTHESARWCSPPPTRPGWC
jgi:ABC-2 type transport system ATP-binding protein